MRCSVVIDSPKRNYIALVQCRESDPVRNQFLWHMRRPDWPMVGYPFPHFGKAGSLSSRDRGILFVSKSSAATFEYLKSVVYLQELESAACSPAFLFGFPVVYIPLVLARPSHVLCLCLHRDSSYSRFMSATTLPTSRSSTTNNRRVCASQTMREVRGRQGGGFLSNNPTDCLESYLKRL